MSGLLLQTKLFKPAPRPSLITRTQLIDRLNEGLGHGAEGFSVRLTLVSAPAGFGKTTLVAAWLAQLATAGPGYAGGNSAWLSLDENDNDPVRFLSYLVAALQAIAPQIGQTALRALQSPQPAAAEAVLTLLINDVSRHDLPVILVLDDYHVISSPPVHQALTYLLEHLSPRWHLLLTTRSDPPLPLPRWRARHHMVELRTDDLRFNVDEIGLFFSQVWGLTLSKEEIAAMERRTEGWITGLQLAALSMKGRVDQAELIADFTGSHHFVIDYLTEEVLNRQTAPVRDFLLATSILKRVCGPLADALTGTETGQETLELLEHANLFLTPLDEERRWYRYHHLFADVLQARLSQTRPDQLRVLHRRAEAWHAREGMVDEAVYHALAAGDPDEAADLIEGVAGTMLRQGASASLVRWLDALPAATYSARPRLCLVRGWTFVWGAALNLEGAEKWVQRALQAVSESPASGPDLRGEVAALQAMIAATWKEEERTIELSRRALAHLPADSPWRGVMNFCLGFAHYSRGEPAVASGVLKESLAQSAQDGVQYIQLIVASLIAEISVMQGHLSQAEELYGQVLEEAGEGLPQKGAVMAHGGLANIFYERNELDAALAHLEIGTVELAYVGGAWPSLAIYRALARVRQAQGNWQEAKADLDRAERNAANAQKDDILAEIAMLRARLNLAQGNLAAAEAWAARRGWDLENSALAGGPLQEAAALTLARVFIAQGRHAEALALLEALLQLTQAEERQGSILAVLVLQTLVYEASGNRTRALKCLARALALGEPQGYCRIFVDEGEPMENVLRTARRQGLMTDYVDRLLDAFAIEEQATSSESALPEPLSERELEVLRLAATGASNKEIAAELFIAVPTVKKHMGNILVKLDAQNRVQAITRARELDLVS